MSDPEPIRKLPGKPDKAIVNSRSEGEGQRLRVPSASVNCLSDSGLTIIYSTKLAGWFTASTVENYTCELNVLWRFVTQKGQILISLPSGYLTSRLEPGLCMDAVVMPKYFDYLKGIPPSLFLIVNGFQVISHTSVQAHKPSCSSMPMGEKAWYSKVKWRNYLSV